MSSKGDRLMTEDERLALRRQIDRMGEDAARKDPGMSVALSAADKLDAQRKGFLMALALLCDDANRRGLPSASIVECLEGAVEGMKRV